MSKASKVRRVHKAIQDRQARKGNKVRRDLRAIQARGDRKANAAPKGRKERPELAERAALRA